MAPNKLCIVGLGNPGPRYQGTRHNIGFDWVDSAVSQVFSSGSKSAPKFTNKFNSLWFEAELELDGNPYEIHFLKPQTYMNESGKALVEWKQKHQGDSNFLIVFDDMDLPVGKLRLRQKGSDGGHRGMRSIIERLGTQEVPRLRLGVGRPSVDGVREETIDHVLEKFSGPEKKAVSKLLADAGSQLKDYVSLSCENFEMAMNKMNARYFGDRTDGN